MGHEFIARDGWQARPPTRPIAPASYPEPRAYLHHEGAGTPPQQDRTAEALYMRRLQATMQARGYADVAYSAVVMPSGRIYEGRDLDAEDAATRGVNDESISILWPGNLEVHRPTLQQLSGVAWLIRLARWVGHLTPTSELLPHRAAVPSTVCPGRHGIDAIGPIRRLVDEPSVPKQEVVVPQFQPPLQIVSWCTFEHPTAGKAVAAVGPDGSVYCEPSAAYRGGATGKPYFAGRAAARIEPNGRGGYTVVATSGERYAYPE